MPLLSLTVSDLPDLTNAKLFTFNGQIDESNLEEVKTKVDPLADDTVTQFLVFNFKDLEYINSKGVGYLAALYLHISKMTPPKKIFIVESGEEVMDILSLVGLNTIIEHFPTTEEALARIKG